MKKILLVLLVIATTISPSCKKGLDGINGKDGKDGVNGKDGSNGANGKDASVMSKLFTITDWQYDSEKIAYYARLNVSSIITPSIVSSGVVLAYAQFPNQVSSNSWSPLPIIFYRTSNYFTRVEFAMSPTGLTVWWTDSDMQTPGTPFTITVRIVAIPGSIATGYHNIDYNNLDLVMKTFDLK